MGVCCRLEPGAKRSFCQVAAAVLLVLAIPASLANFAWPFGKASEILQSGVIRRCRSNTSERRRAGTMSRDHFREASQRCATARTPRSCVPPQPVQAAAEPERRNRAASAGPSPAVPAAAAAWLHGYTLRRTRLAREKAAARQGRSASHQVLSSPPVVATVL